MDNIGERIKQVRKYTKKTQTIFADEIGITQAHLSGIENNKDKPSKTLLKLISLMYNVSLAWLETGIGSLEIAWNIETDEGNLALYNNAKHKLDNFVLVQKDNALQSIAAAMGEFSFLLQRVDSYCFTNEDRNIYFACIENILSALGRIAGSPYCIPVQKGATFPNINTLLMDINYNNQFLKEIDENSRNLINHIYKMLDINYFEF